MIRLNTLEERPDLLRKTLVHDDNVFIEAREFYQWNKDMRHHKILVYKDRKPAYVLSYQKNEPEGINKHDPKVQMQLSNFWDYSVYDNDCDFTYVDRYDLIIFETLDEYAWASARQIIDQNRNIKLAFLDQNAALFFDEEKVAIAENEEELFGKYPELKEGEILRVHSPMKWSLSDFFNNDVPSVMVMTSLYWLKRKFAYGDLNPDKTFYLIKHPVKENGITAVAANVIGLVEMLKKKHLDIIPVVDLSVEGDFNQFTLGSGEDVWRMFFKDICDIPLEEIYSSKNVILDQNSNISFNPYLIEFVYGEGRKQVKFKDILEYQEEVNDYVCNKLQGLFPQDKRVLGVVARGSDLLILNAANKDYSFISNEELFEKVKAHMNEGGFDYLFLATEDVNVLRMYEDSEFKDRLITIDQIRVDYRIQADEQRVLFEIFTQGNSDPYQRTLDYIAVLEGLKRCNGLCGNALCGTVNYVLGFDPAYEFVDVG